MTRQVPLPDALDIEKCVEAITDFAQREYRITYSTEDLYHIRTQLMQLGGTAPLLILSLAALSNAKAGGQKRSSGSSNNLNAPWVIACSLVIGTSLWLSFADIPWLAWSSAILAVALPASWFLHQALRERRARQMTGTRTEQ